MNDRPKVLAVDDNQVNLLLIKRILAEKEIEVVTAVNGAEAVEKATEGSFDLILMDLHMPVMDGYDATWQIRNNHFANPILALSANLNNESIRKCKAMGMNDCHSKPFQRKQLIAFVERWLAV